MAETASPTSPTSSPAPKNKDQEDKKILSYTIVPFPKVIFFYPMMCAAFICGLFESFGTQSNVAGMVFVIVFLINILVISFDFPGVKALALSLGSIAIIFGLILLNQHFPFFTSLQAILKEKIYDNLHASAVLYFCISAILFLMIGGGMLGSFLWDRWTIEPNRLKHKDGLFTFREYPVIDLQVDKEVEDIFEYILLGSGTLTFRIPNNPTFRLENIPFINRKQAKIQMIVRHMRIKEE